MKKIKTDKNILNNEEICRITYADGYFKRLMKQTYKKGKPFFTVEHGKWNFTPVETSSTCLSAIIAHLNKCLLIDMEDFNNRKYNEQVTEIIGNIFKKDKDFIEMIKEAK